MLDKNILGSLVTDNGNSVIEFSQNHTVMMVFLRHFGCVFCREALKDISAQRLNWENEGTKIILVHPSTKEEGDKYLSQFNLLDIETIADPNCVWYERFGLAKGNFSQLFGLQTIIRGFELAAKGTLPTLKQVGDGFQMPGIFLIKAGQIRDKYIHKSASDRPDYESLLQCCAA